MAHRQFKLTKQEIAQLRIAADKTRNVKELKRLQAVRLYGEGQTVDDILNLVDCSERSLLRWCEQYRAAGVEGLKSKYRGDNAARLSAEQRAEVRERLARNRPDQILPPEIRISQGEFWTVSDLRIAIQRWYGVTWQSDTSYRTLLKACNFSQQRPENRYRSRASEQAIADFEAELEKKGPTCCKCIRTWSS
jgi:transposase